MLQEGDIITIIRPFFKEIKGAIEEGLGDNQAHGTQKREVAHEDGQDEEDGKVVEKEEDAALDLVGEGVEELGSFSGVGWWEVGILELPRPQGNFLGGGHDFVIVKEKVSG